MAKKTIFTLIIIGLIILFGIFSFFTFNPIANHHQIEQIKVIMAKVKIYDETHSLTPLQLKYFWETMPVTDEESKVIEATGLMVIKHENYIGLVSSGFDNTIVYNYSQDCWYSQHVKIVGLAMCKNNNW